MRKLNAVTTQMVIYPIGKNPIYDEESTTITITDEAGGPFIELSQLSDTTSEPNTIRLELEELDMIHIKSYEMLRRYEDAMKLGEGS